MMTTRSSFTSEQARSLRGLSTGASLVRAAQELADARTREQWPFVHVYPPPNSIPVHQIDYIDAPAQGSSAVVLQYVVPEGFTFFLRSILQVFSGGSLLAGDALWTVRVNTVNGVTDRQAMPVQGLVAVPVPLGSITAGNQWVLPRAYDFAPLDVVESVAENVNLGAGKFVSGFFGYLVPVI